MNFSRTCGTYSFVGEYLHIYKISRKKSAVGQFMATRNWTAILMSKFSTRGNDVQRYQTLFSSGSYFCHFKDDRASLTTVRLILSESSKIGVEISVRLLVA